MVTSLSQKVLLISAQQSYAKAKILLLTSGHAGR